MKDSSSVKMFLAKYPPYSSDVASCDFYMILKIKSALERTLFGSVEDLKEDVARIIKITEKYLGRSMDNCRNREETNSV